MKKLNELIAKRASAIQEMDTLNAQENLTDEQRSKWDSLLKEVETMNEEVSRLERQRELNEKYLSVNIITNSTKDGDERSLIRAWDEYATSGIISADFRGKNNGFQLPEDIFKRATTISTTDANGNLKNPSAAFDVLPAPGELFLRSLGVNILTNLAPGTLPLTGQQATKAVQPAESGDSSANTYKHASILLTPARIDHFDSYSREFLAQTNLFPMLINELYAGVWAGVAQRWMTKLVAGIVDASVASPAGSLTFANVLTLEKAVLDRGMYGAASYLTTPAGRNYLQSLNASAAGIKFVWGEENKINGSPAFAANIVPAKHVLFGEFGKSYVGLWGAPEIVIDPYSLKKKGQIEVYMVQMADAGTPNSRFFSYFADASMGV
jgi:HK97 family phage major capsid protein